MTELSKYLMTAVISSVLASGCLIATSSKAFADIKIGNNQQTNQTKTNSQVYSIDEWPEVREELCGKCKSDRNSDENKVSVPEPSSVIALVILGGSLLLTNKIKPRYIWLRNK
ncbi:PEP-CTERM sorting domain-containing protein [Argonema antarcticum]|uniref:PEP-CTERM sorting domain-containing protein n=1 Tax=Argonema antarcticum TaxID=2942763 RepID=UPI0020111160|nr:PEP-CTERM sorting domain-containing protein [Argonema antarcticum]MCL1471936.1 PEP-CTERM sorting domain-containing protein [Argonema antarcticum A004/B2]